MSTLALVAPPKLKIVLQYAIVWPVHNVGRDGRTETWTDADLFCKDDGERMWTVNSDTILGLLGFNVNPNFLICFPYIFFPSDSLFSPQMWNLHFPRKIKIYMKLHRKRSETFLSLVPSHHELHTPIIPKSDYLK